MVLLKKESHRLTRPLKSIKRRGRSSISAQHLPPPLPSVHRHVPTNHHPLPRRRQAAPEIHARQTCHRGMPSPTPRPTVSLIFRSMIPSSSPLSSGTKLHPPTHPDAPSPLPATTPHASSLARMTGCSSSSVLARYTLPSRPSRTQNFSELRSPPGKTC